MTTWRVTFKCFPIAGWYQRGYGYGRYGFFRWYQACGIQVRRYGGD